MTKSRQQLAQRRGDPGVAAIEFVIVFPLLLGLFLATVNVAQFITVTRRINTAAELVADLVSRHDQAILVGNIDDYFTAAELSFRPLDPKNVRIDVYDYFRDVSDNAKKRWARSSTGGKKCTEPDVKKGSSLDNLLEDGNDVVVAVVCTDFSAPDVTFPGMRWVFGKRTVEKQMMFRPRESAILECTDCNS